MNPKLKKAIIFAVALLGAAAVVVVSSRQAQSVLTWPQQPQEEELITLSFPGAPTCRPKHLNYVFSFCAEGDKDACKAIQKVCDMQSLLKAWTALAQGMGWQWWLDGMTLLGAIRDHQVIPYTNDLDIGVFVPKYTEGDRFLDGYATYLDLNMYNLDVREISDTHGPMASITFKDGRSGILLINPYFEGKANNLIKRSTNGEAWPHEEVLPTVDCMISGLKCNCPASSEKILVELYGDGWKNPDTTWDRYAHKWININEFGAPARPGA